MEIEGLDYNTQRKKLLLPEYGREIQDMVNYCVDLPTKEERQQCAETIVSIMDRMNPQSRENTDYEQKLWDHLAIMADNKAKTNVLPNVKNTCSPLWKNDVRTIRSAKNNGRWRRERRTR